MLYYWHLGELFIKHLLLISWKCVERVYVESEIMYISCFQVCSSPVIQSFIIINTIIEAVKSTAVRMSSNVKFTLAIVCASVSQWMYRGCGCTQFYKMHVDNALNKVWLSAIYASTCTILNSLSTLWRLLSVSWEYVIQYAVGSQWNEFCNSSTCISIACM